MKKPIFNSIFLNLYKSSMMLFIYSLFFACFSSFATVKSQNSLPFNFKESKIENIIHYIENNSKFRFLYETNKIDLTKKVNLHYDGDIVNAVNILFGKTNIQPIIINNQIILKLKQVSFQKRIVSGIVKNSDGLPLFGVAVLVNDIERGTATNEEGKYSIEAKTGDSILFTYMGCKDKKIIVGSSDVINITLEIDFTSLDEIVLVGYGQKDKKNISTSISTVKSNDIENDIQSGSSIDRSLAGMAKGLRVVQGSGRPGSGVDINIRGYTSPFSNSSNNPLFVIDGVPIQAKEGFGSSSNPLNSINPNDIESLNILKDAAATSIYGSRGANGVIIIKTKTGGKNEDLEVNITAKATFSKPINTLKYLDANEYKLYVDGFMKKEVDEFQKTIPFSAEWGELFYKLSNYGDFGVILDPMTYQASYDFSKAKYGNSNTNWSDVVYRNAAYTKEYDISLRGGTEQTIYGLSLHYIDQEGLLKADNFKQYNARLNLSFSPNDKWDIGTNISLGSTENKTGYVSFNNDLNKLLEARPDLPIYDEKGEISTYVGNYGLYYINPLGMTTKGYDNGVGKTATGNIFVEYEILKGLKLKGALNFAYFNSKSNNFIFGKYSSMGFLPSSIPEMSLLTISNSENIEIVGDFTANYQKKFNEKHAFDFLVGFSKTRDYFEADTNMYSGFTNENLRFPQYAGVTQPGSLLRVNNGLNSYMGRVGYSYDNKYNASATLRLDQSSKFAPSNRNAWFPSIAASWNIHNENFMKNKEKINNLKLRFSYGFTGSTNVPSFTFIQKFVSGPLYNGQNSVGPSSELSNSRAAWEKTKEYNLGLDFGLFKNKISGGIDLYKRRTEGALISSPFPLETGATSFTDNFATIENKGVEVDLNVDIINTESFQWSIGANASRNINKLIDFNKNFVDSYFLDDYEKGKEINLIKGYVVEGIYQTQNEIDELNAKATQKNHPFYDQSIAPGDYKMKDVNGDGKISGEDRVILGSSQPDIYGGFRTNAKYKDFTLGVSFNYSFGSEVTRTFFDGGLTDATPYKNIEKQFAPEYRWSPDNTSAKLPRIGSNTFHNARISSENVYDASYVRLKSIRLNYALPYEIVNKLKLLEVNLYLLANNLYTWTNYPGVDPESVSGGAFTTSTSNRDPYPISKSWTFGVNVKF